MSLSDESPHVWQVLEDVVAFHASDTRALKWPRLTGVEDNVDIWSFIKVTVDVLACSRAASSANIQPRQFLDI